MYVTVFKFPLIGSHIPSPRRCMLGTCLRVAGNSQILFLSERQDLLSPCMILNACVHRLHPEFSVPCEGRGTNLLRSTQNPHLHRPGFEPRTFGMGGERSTT